MDRLQSQEIGVELSHRVAGPWAASSGAAGGERSGGFSVGCFVSGRRGVISRTVRATVTRSSARFASFAGISVTEADAAA